jgi:hypothetical protein
VEKQGSLRTAEADTLDDLADTTPLGLRPASIGGVGRWRGGAGKNGAARASRSADMA